MYLHLICVYYAAVNYFVHLDGHLNYYVHLVLPNEHRNEEKKNLGRTYAEGIAVGVDPARTKWSGLRRGPPSA